MAATVDMHRTNREGTREGTRESTTVGTVTGSERLTSSLVANRYPIEPLQLHLGDDVGWFGLYQEWSQGYD